MFFSLNHRMYTLTIAASISRIFSSTDSFSIKPFLLEPLLLAQVMLQKYKNKNNQLTLDESSGDPKIPKTPIATTPVAQDT